MPPSPPPGCAGTPRRACRRRKYGSARVCVRRAFGRSPSPPPQRCHGGSSLGAAARPRVHIRATEPAARTRGYAAPRVPSPSSERHGAGRRRARASASKRVAPSAAGAAGSARCDASQAEPRRRRGRSRSLPRARRSPPIRTRSWRPSRPARTPQCAHQPRSEQCGGHWARATSALPGAVAVRAGRSEVPRPPGDRVGRAGQRRATAGVVVDLRGGRRPR